MIGADGVWLAPARLRSGLKRKRAGDHIPAIMNSALLLLE